MDASENIVNEYLKHQKYEDIVYEPDGNVPPDFLVNGRIAIEVRRLNQNKSDGGGSKGLEETAIPLRKKIEKLAFSFGPPDDGESWFLFYRFSRPIGKWKTIETKLKEELQRFRDKKPRVKTSLRFEKGLEFEIFRASKPHDTFFVMAGYSDEESGGWLIPEIKKNLELCITEKTYKIRNVKSKYPEWWLVLIDLIGYGLDDFDKQQFREQVSIEHDWQKIILINPSNYKESFEI
jgi:hypothetical protein